MTENEKLREIINVCISNISKYRSSQSIESVEKYLKNAIRSVDEPEWEPSEVVKEALEKLETKSWELL